MPDLTILIVNWNTAALLRDCLLSITSCPPPTEIVLVDNASTDGSAEMVTREFPQVRLIHNSVNLGFARANNQGLRASQERYVLFLNSDTCVPQFALARLVGFMEEHLDAGACSPRLARRDGSPQPFAFGDDPTPGYLLARGLARIFLHRALHNWETCVLQSVAWVSGASLLVRRAALDQVGGFDEKFFMYFEDNDLCLRLRRAGWTVYYNPQVSITHLGGASLTQNQERFKYYDASLRYFYAKHYSPLARLTLEIMLPFYRRMA